MDENELRVKLQEFGFTTKDGIEWTKNLDEIGRIGVRFSCRIYKTAEVRISINHGTVVKDKNDTYAKAYRMISEIMIKNALLS